MICKNCGGQIPDGTKVCSFCETEACSADYGNKGEPTELELRMAEILMGPGCNDGIVTAEEPKPTWWKEEEGCASCGAGLTGTDKDMKYVLAIVGLIAGVIVFALAVKFLFGLLS